MAKQHFYSRVPAKVSMYNRSDGYDTFAHSDGLEREFIERELSAVYENKLTKNDMEAVRKGLMPLVYSQCCLRSGSLVHSCVRYLPRDYTGERSAYMCHSLILTDEERQTLLCSRENAPMNPAMFVTDINTFDFVSSEAAADSNYPQKAYTPIPVGDIKALVKKYDPDTMKCLLFSVLFMLCGKGKPIYFKLHCPDMEVSDEALKLIGAVMAVIPYHLRHNISFVTYITDPAQYPYVKLKCVSEHCPEVPAGKGVFMDFYTGLVTGMPGDEIVSKTPVNFFYSLMEDTAVRDEFLIFMDRAVKAVPSLERLNMKTLSDLVFLFAATSGLFTQQTILPNDDKIYDFLCVYDKYRNALSEEYRRNAYRCLERYPARHEAIPKNIFAKLSRLYPSEINSAKRIAMNTVLELIHTDIMRDKLFTFIRNNYDGEDADIRALINVDLCRVFYGEFLQLQILAFFTERFPTEPEQTRSAVFDKLMLTIRTEAIQAKILEFIRQNYQYLSQQQKQRFYTTFYEMLPECDNLSALMIVLVDELLANEEEEWKLQVRQKLAALLEADSRRKEPKLMPLLVGSQGFCREVTLELILGQWNTRKIYTEFIELLAQKSVAAKTEELLHILEMLSADAEAVVQKLLQSVEQMYAADHARLDLYGWLEVQQLVDEASSQWGKVFALELKDKVIQPAIADALPDVFNTKLNRDGLAVITAYAKANPYLAKTQQYHLVDNFRKMIKAAAGKDAKTVFLCLNALPVEKPIRNNMAGYIKTNLLNQPEQSPEQILLLEMCANMLRKGVLLADDTYALCKERYVQQMGQKQPAKAVNTAANRSAERILDDLSVACRINSTFAEIVCGDLAGLGMLLRGFTADHGKGADKWVLNHLSGAPAELTAVVKKLLEGIKPPSKSLFARLFGR